jgi:hypothetical protein
MENLNGTHFPASKTEIMDHVESGPGPDTQDVVEIVRRIPDREYVSLAEILHEIGKIE